MTINALLCQIISSYGMTNFPLEVNSSLWWEDSFSDNAYIPMIHLLIEGISQGTKNKEKAGAKLGQAQYKICYLGKLMSSASCNASLMSSSIEIVFH